MIPTITSITPDSAPSMGSSTVTIIGTGFRLPTPPPATGIAPVPPESVRVLFGTTPAESVLVLSATRLLVFTPRVRLLDADEKALNVLEVDITVENIDDSGVLIPTETVTELDGFTFFRPDISSENSGELANLVREFINSIRSCVIDNVVMTQAKEYSDEDSEPYTVIAETPGIALLGPSLERSTNPDGNVDTLCTWSLTETITIKSPKIVHVLFEVTGYADNPADYMNLMQLFTEWVERTGRISVPRDPLDLSKGYSQHEIEFVEGGDGTAGKEYGPAMNSNVQYFTMMLRVRDCIISGIPGVDFDAAKGYAAEVEEVLLDVVRLSDTPSIDLLQPRTP